MVDMRKTIQLSFGLNQTTDSLKPLECQRALGMESGTISDFQISASSEWDSGHAAFYGRLHLVATPRSHSGVWASGISDENQWLQVDLGIHSSSTITRVATQGRTDLHNQWVTKYKLQHCNDGMNFQYYRELGQTTHKVRHTESNCRFSVTLVSRHVAKIASCLSHVMLKLSAYRIQQNKKIDEFSLLLGMSRSSATPSCHIRKSQRG